MSAMINMIMAGASLQMFPPLSCLFLLFGLPPGFPLGKFPLPVLALEKGLYLREQDMGQRTNSIPVALSCSSL